MTSDPFSDARIVDAWTRNASPWTAAIRENRITSRTLATNQAIVDAVLSRSPRMVLDIGCGEGWLVRALAERGVHAIGLDVAPGLIEQARLAGGGDFRVASYEQIATGELDPGRVDVAVANFSLIGKESVDAVVQRVPRLLNPGGSLVIQTVHTLVACGDASYVDGWREGFWPTSSEAFSAPAPWYFRTIESWVRLIVESGFRLTEMREPLHPSTQRPASVIFVAEAN